MLKDYSSFITDGRDSSQHGLSLNIREHFKNHQFFEVGSIGRAFAMDRKKDWQNIEKTYNLITLGEEKKYKVPKRQYPGLIIRD